VKNKNTVRSENKDKFKQCLKLRSEGLSYSEIQKVIPIAKSTLQNWLTLGGLTLTCKHLEIQLNKRIEKQNVATEASRLTRIRNREQFLKTAEERYNKFFTDQLFVMGIALYEAEGSKYDECRFSNSDYRVIKIFLLFLEKYFSLNIKTNAKFSLFIHETRRQDVSRILAFWSDKLSVNKAAFKIFWKRNEVAKKRNNLDYVGQIQVRITGMPYMTRKLLLFSGIIMKPYLTT
jgi:hypothetical protein